MTGGHCDGGVAPLYAAGLEGKFEHIDHVKVDNVKDFQRLVVCDGGEQRSHRIVDAHVDDEAEVGSKVLHKLNANGLLYPELNVPVDAGGDDEVRLLGDQDEFDRVSVHEGSFVCLTTRQVVQVDLLKWNDLFLLLWH